jgi:hypothetical protein
MAGTKQKCSAPTVDNHATADNYSGGANSPQPGDIRSLTRSLRALGRSAKAREQYGETAAQFAEYLTERGMPTQVASIAPEHVEAWLAGLRDQGRAQSTVSTRCSDSRYSRLHYHSHRFKGIARNRLRALHSLPEARRSEPRVSGSPGRGPAFGTVLSASALG